MLELKELKNISQSQKIVMETETLGERIRLIRRKRKLRQDELAKLAASSKIQMGRYERDQTEPTSGVLLRIGRALEVSVDYLLTGEDLGKEAPQKGNGTPPLKDQQLFKQFIELEGMPHKDREVVKQLIEAFIVNRKVKDLAKR